MTTQTQPNPAQPVPAQIKTPQAQSLELLARIATALEALQDSIGHLIEISDTTAEHAANTAEALARFGQAMASGPAPAPAAAPQAGNYETFPATAIEFGIMAGKPVYKIKGGRYAKFGVRVWPEAMSAMGIAADALKPGDNPISGNVVALIGERGPQKIVAWAKGN